MSERVRLYAGTQHGLIVWHSNNSDWEELGRDFADGIIDSIAGCRLHPQRVFVGITHNGLYRTEDGGRHWGKVLDGDIRAVTIDPTSDDVVYAGVEPVGLYRSEDRGENWIELSSLRELPQEVKKNWRFPQPPHQGHVRNIFIHPDNSKIIYLCIEHGGVVRSFDRGKSWEDVSQGIDYLDIHVILNLPSRFDRYFLATARGFFTSDNPAEGWVRAENGLTRDYFHDFLLRRLGRGIPENLDPMIWALVHHPYDPDAVFAGLGDVARGHASGSGGAGKILLSRDRGESWQEIKINLPADRVLWAAAD
ncbi:MAG: hypothetical protein HYU47_13540 [Deltaproteobacteria bacterium]|nr:hypothetical protein [Deltaproteobacteria bacterium]